MATINKGVVLGLSITVVMYVLYVIKSSGEKALMVSKDSMLCLESKCMLSSSKLVSTKEDPDVSSPRDTQCISSQGTLPISATSNTTPTSHNAAQRRNILYLIQTEQCIPPYFKLNDVFGTPNLGYEVIVLSYKEACLDTSMPHVQYLLDKTTTWTTGRNVLFEAAMNRENSYLYYVFMDDDFALGDPRQERTGPWRRFENALRSYEPAIAAIDIGWVPKIRDFHFRRQCSGEVAEFIGTVWFDAICNAFHYKAIRHILPYDPTFDQQTWWASQMSVIIRSEVLFRGQVAIHSELFGRNEQHRPYPRDFNFTPDMIKHMTKDLDKLVPSVRASCAYVTMQQWRTIYHWSHGSNSSTLCLHPAPYHDTIEPGRYACA